MLRTEYNIVSRKVEVMEYNHLLELIKTVSALNISGFQYEEGGVKLVITTGGNSLPGAGVGMTQTVNTVAGEEAVKIMPSMLESAVVTGEEQGSKPSVSPDREVVGNIIKSPLVGTFYAAPAEGADPFVSIGDVVKKGQTLAIVEAMKLMNDIEAEYDGKILEVFVENGDSVEYGQPLFAIG